MIKHTSIVIALAIVLAGALSACSALASPTATATANRSSLDEDVALAAGTLALEGTDQAVTADQATELAFLWKAYGSLSTDDSTAAAELEALLDQISGDLTTDQREAIAAMALDDSAVQELVADLGIIVGSNSEAETSTTAMAAGPMGGNGAMPAMEGGQAPADGGMMVDAGAPAATGSTSAASPTTSAAPLLTALIQELVTTLQAKV